MTLQELSTKLMNIDFKLPTQLPKNPLHKKLLIAGVLLTLLTGSIYTSGFVKGSNSLPCLDVNPLTKVLFYAALEGAADKSVHNPIYTQGLISGMKSQLNTCGK